MASFQLETSTYQDRQVRIMTSKDKPYEGENDAVLILSAGKGQLGWVPLTCAEARMVADVLNGMARNL